MFNHDDIINNYSIDFDYSQIEPEIESSDKYELSKQFIDKLEEWLAILMKKEPKSLAVWGLAFAVGSKHCEGMSMTEVAKRLGVTKAAISKQAKQFCEETNLPPSPYMAPKRARYGKETEAKRIIRLAQMTDEKDLFHEKVCEFFRTLIDNNLDKFEDGTQSNIMVKGERYGRIYRNYNYETGKKVYTDISQVFIRKSAIRKLFKGISEPEEVIKAFKKSNIFIKKTARSIDYQVIRGYLLWY